MRVSRIATVCGLLLCIAWNAQAQWTWTPQTGRFVDIDRLPKETAELQIEYTRSLLLEKQYKRAMKETNKFKEFYADTDFADENQYLRGEIRLAMGDLLAAANEYQQMLSAYPNSELYNEAIEKQYQIGDRLYELGLVRADAGFWRPFKGRPLKRAVEVYSMVVENQPFTPQAAEAQYKIGLCHYARDKYLDAALEYRRVVEDYPDSEWVDEASYGLAMCYYEGSFSPDYDQTPAKLAVEAVDDFSIRYPGDARLAELQGKRSEMLENIAEAKLRNARYYERKRDFMAAKLTYQVLAQDYPGTSAAATAEQWLQAHPSIGEPGRRHFAGNEDTL